MNKFRTELNIKKYPFNINYRDKLFFIGSCFSENISLLFRKYKFNIYSNPAGILYNPISISNILNFVIDKKEFKENDLFYANNKYSSLYYHGSFSDKNLEEALNKINKNIINSNIFLKETDYLFITFGSSFIYEFKDNNIIVSNCHKLNQSLFNQRLLDISEIVNNYINLINKIINLNPNIKIIFTISPIRYLKYGNEENSISKSILFIAINKLKKIFKNIYYFPSYEIVLDDLRDYRFYNEDMIHPNNQAIKYIFDKLIDSIFDNNTLLIMKKMEKIINAKIHIPFDSKSNDYIKFCNNAINKITDLTKEFPYIDLKEEEEFFKVFI